MYLPERSQVLFDKSASWYTKQALSVNDFTLLHFDKNTPMFKSAIKILWDPTVPREGPDIPLSYPTVPWDRWDCPWESIVLPEGPIYPTVRPTPLYNVTGGNVHGSPLSHLRGPHIPLFILFLCTMGQVRLSMGAHCPS